MHVDRESTQTDQSFHLIGSLTEIVAGQTTGGHCGKEPQGLCPSSAFSWFES